jgi:hypothetical protein
VRSRRQAGGEAGNAAEVAGERHGATEELRDREVHHVGAILGVVLAGLGGGGRSGSLPTASLPQLDRASAGSPSSLQFALLIENEVVGAARWPAGKALR